MLGQKHRGPVLLQGHNLFQHLFSLCCIPTQRWDWRLTSTLCHNTRVLKQKLARSLIAVISWRPEGAALLPSDRLHSVQQRAVLHQIQFSNMRAHIHARQAPNSERIDPPPSLPPSFPRPAVTEIMSYLNLQTAPLHRGGEEEEEETELQLSSPSPAHLSKHSEPLPGLDSLCFTPCPPQLDCTSPRPPTPVIILPVFAPTLLGP